MRLVSGDRTHDHRFGLKCMNAVVREFALHYGSLCVLGPWLLQTQCMHVERHVCTPLLLLACLQVARELLLLPSMES